MAELVEFRMSGGKVETRPAVQKSEADRIWRCGPCAAGVGECCTRKPESLPPAARKVLRKAAEPTNMYGESLSAVRDRVRKLAANEPPAPLPDPMVELAEALRVRESVPSHLRGQYDRRQAAACLKALEGQLREVQR